MTFCCIIFSRGEVPLKVLAGTGICKLPSSLLKFLVVDKMFDPSTMLLNDSCHPNIEIVNIALQYVCQNSFNFAFDVLVWKVFQLMKDCPRKTGLSSNPKEVVWWLRSGEYGGLKIASPFQNLLVPWKVLSQALESAPLKQWESAPTCCKATAFT